MTDQTPDTVTETIRVDQLTPGRTILMPCEPETVTEIWTAHGYVNFRTDKTGPASAYQWPAGDGVDVVRTLHAIDATLAATTPEDAMAAEPTPSPYADRIPAPRPVPTTRQRLTDARTCGHTPDQHRHDDGQAADAASHDRAIRELTAERDGLRDDIQRVEQTRQEQVTELRQQLDAMKAAKKRVLGRLEMAEHVIDLMRDASEQQDRALAAWDTQPGVTPVELVGDTDPTAVQDMLDDATRTFADAGTSSDRVEVVRDLLANWYAAWPSTAVTDEHEGIAHQIVALVHAAEARAGASSVPPRRAQEPPTAEALAEHLTAYQWYSKPEFPLLHEPSAHREHHYNSDCAICRGDWVSVAGVALAFVLAERKG